jgi:type IV secretory pathway TraG/TraD family ATPase VirD4
MRLRKAMTCGCLPLGFQSRILSAFCGKTTIPLDLTGKQMIVMGLDREKRDVVAPLLAMVLHMIVTRNVTQKRQVPLVLALDELPTLYLPALVQWLNENRSMIDVAALLIPSRI